MPSLSLGNFQLNDDDYNEMSLGFSFPYFGKTYSSVFIGSNGYLTFGQGDTRYSATATAHNALPRVSALYTDLDPSDETAKFYVYRSSDRGVFSVLYYDVKQYSQSEGARNRFQIVLRRDGSITFAYSAVTTNQNAIGVGLSSQAALQHVDISAGSGGCAPAQAPFELFAAESRTDLGRSIITFDASSNYQYCVRDWDGWPVPYFTSKIQLGDDAFEELALGFSFPYFGATYSSVFVGSNGYLTFGQGDTRYSASAAEHNALPRISALFTDLNPADEATTMYVYQRDGVFAVIYMNVKEYGQRSGDRNSFQVVLREDGSITIAYSWVSASKAIGVGLSSRGALQQVDLSAGSRTCARASDPESTDDPIPSPSPPETEETLVCNFGEGKLYLQWDGEGTAATCVDSDTGDMSGELICAADANIDRSAGAIPGLVATCIPATSMMCLEAEGQLVVTWTDKGERAVCTDESGAAVGAPLDCVGTFQVDRLIEPEAALDAICLTGTLAEDHPNNSGNNGGAAADMIMGRRLLFWPEAPSHMP